MRIKWLNDERTEVMLSRGLLFWRRTAIVVRVGYEKWRYESTGDDVDPWICRELEMKAIMCRIAAEQRDKDQRNWRRGTTLPRARLVERNQ